MLPKPRRKRSFVAEPASSRWFTRTAWAGYHGLVDLGYNTHLRVEHRENIFAQQLNHINGIESFWSLAKRRLARFCGVPKRTFYLHLKETEFRFNHRNNNLYRELLKFLRKDAL